MTVPAALAPPPPAPITSENPAAAVTGTVRGGTVVLDDAAALPEGARVSVAAVADPPAAPDTTDDPAAAAKAAFGAWAEDAEELDAFIEETYRLRHSPRDHWLPGD